MGPPAEVTEFMKALTDPSTRNLQHIIPEWVPSGIPVDGALGSFAPQN